MTEKYVKVTYQTTIIHQVIYLATTCQLASRIWPPVSPQGLDRTWNVFLYSMLGVYNKTMIYFVATLIINMFAIISKNVSGKIFKGRSIFTKVSPLHHLLKVGWNALIQCCDLLQLNKRTFAKSTFSQQFFAIVEIMSLIMLVVSMMILMIVLMMSQWILIMILSSVLTMVLIMV